MPPKNYRYYCLDSTGQLHNSVLFEADSDEDAIRQIEARHPHDKCEIWEGKRLVAMLEPRATESPAAASLRRLADSRRVLRETAAIVARSARHTTGGDAR